MYSEPSSIRFVLIQGNVEQLMLPPLDDAPLDAVPLRYQLQSTEPNTEQLIPSVEASACLPGRNRTWTGASSTLTGLAASDWSLGGSSHPSDLNELVSKTHDHEAPQTYEHDTVGTSVALDAPPMHEHDTVGTSIGLDAPPMHEHDTAGTSISLPPYFDCTLLRSPSGTMSRSEEAEPLGAPASLHAAVAQPVDTAGSVTYFNAKVSKLI